MKKLIFYCFVLLSTSLFAQVGINTTTPNAQLDIRSSNQVAPASTDGMLIPKIDAFPATNPSAAQQGMLVYLTTNVGSNQPGFYYWNNPTLTWIPIGNNNNSGWNLTGNSISGTEFIGTTNDQDIIFRRFNTNAGRIGDVNTSFGFLSGQGGGVRNAAFGLQAMQSHAGVNNSAFGYQSLVAAGNGSNNAAFGAFSLTANTTGGNNTAIGDLSLSNNTTGSSNTAVGANSLSSNIVGLQNTSVGHFSLSANTANNNTAIGFASMNANTTGISNTAVGVSALNSNSTASENSAFGFFSLAANTIGFRNTAVGYRSLSSNTTGVDNVAVGNNSLEDNTTGNFNTAIGSLSLLSNTTGNRNVAVGRLSLRLNTSGSLNTSIGDQSLFSNTIGGNNISIGVNSSILSSSGSQNIAIGTSSFATNTIGFRNTIIGDNADVSINNLFNATAIGANAEVGSNNSLVLGSISGINGAISNVNVGIGTTTPQDRLHVVGNLRMVDGNQATGRVLTSDVNGTATWTNPIGTTNGTLDQAYDFGGAGSGNTIIADAGAVLISGTDGLVSTGTTGVGAISPSGAGTRMVWNPRKGAFRAGTVSGTEWDDSNVGNNSIAMGFGTRATGISCIALGSNSSAVGFGSVAFGWSVNANATQSTAFGLGTMANNIYSTAFGYQTRTSGRGSTSFGVDNEAESFGEVVLGIGATAYTPSTNGANQFRLANATDRLLVVGNAIDTDNDDTVDNSERSNALVILKNGNTGIGSSTPAERLHVAGRTLLTDGFSTTNAALLYQNNTDYMFLGPQSGSSTNGGAMALYGATNATAGNAGGVDFNIPNGQMRINHTNGGFVFDENSTSGYTATFELNDIALELGHNSATRAIVFNTASTERMRVTPAGFLGIGTNNPQQKLHVSGPAGLTAVRIGNTSLTGATSNVALDFFRGGTLNTDWRIYNIGPNLTFGNSGDDYATVNDLYQFQGGRFMPMTDGTINLGFGANKWNTVFALNGTINTSDARQKKNVQSLTYGLNTVMQLRPVSFEWKKDDGSGTKLGLIAQELQKVIPEVVRDWDWEEDEQGNRKKVISPILGVYYSDLIPVLIKATQEQQEIIVNQNSEIELLKNQLQMLIDRIESLEKK